MEIKKLWTLPIVSSDIENGVKISNNGIDIILSFRYHLEGSSQKEIEIKFDKVLCYLRETERYITEWFDSYDTLVSVEDSEWLKKLKKLDFRYFEFWKPKHFAIYFDSDAQYQFIAKGFTINEKEVTNELSRIE